MNKKCQKYKFEFYEDKSCVRGIVDLMIEQECMYHIIRNTNVLIQE